MIGIEWSAPARIDLAATDDSFSAIDVTLADRMIDRIELTGVFLRKHPFAGPAILSGAVRKWRVRGAPYRLFHRALHDRILIPHIRHDRADWEA